MKIPLLTLLAALLLLTACAPPTDQTLPNRAAVDRAVSTAVAQTLQANPLPTPAPNRVPPSPSPIPAAQCLVLIEPHAVKTAGRVHTTLSAQEFNGYLGLMGIEKLCIPPDLGAPYLNADWDSAKMPGSGRMLSIGFDNQYPGMGWGGFFLLYSTYDFKFGSEYDIFARTADRDALRSGSMPGSFSVGGASGFARVSHSQFCMGNCSIYKTAVFPFEKYYIALVADVGFYDAKVDWNSVAAGIQAGELSAERKPAAQALELLLQGIRFKPSVQ